MNATRRELCFLLPAICAAPAFSSTVAEICGTAPHSKNIPADLEEASPFAEESMKKMLGGVIHELAGQLMVIQGVTELAQEQLEHADRATLENHLLIVQQSSQRASAVLKLFEREAFKHSWPWNLK